MSTYKKKTGLTFYTVATVVTLVVGTVYEFFSHQVYSPFMYLLFMIPLVLGVMPNLVAKMTRKTFLESEDAQAAYKMGVLTFIFGSFLKGIFDDSTYVFVVSDGRTSESQGLSLKQLAEFMKELNVTTAYNLDGGGSSTMYFNGQIINKPTTNGRNIEEREVSDIVYL